MTPEGPCSWPYIPCPCDALDSMATEGVAEMVDLASFLLWSATGKVYGPCPVSVLPCGQGLLCGYCRESLRSCGCRRVPEIKLPGPVHSVIEVVIDGDVVDPFSYRIDDYQWLVRLDDGNWPNRADPLDPDGFRVDYMLGAAPPSGAGLMTGILACELAKAVCNDDSCRLPRRVRIVTRQGVRIEWAPGQGFGLPDVDQWVEAANAPIVAGAVYSPDFGPIRRTTWTADTSPTSP